MPSSEKGLFFGEVSIVTAVTVRPSDTLILMATVMVAQAFESSNSNWQ
jgi:hypothetical protein